MNIPLTGKEILALWRLAVAGGGDWLKDVRPELDPRERGRLKGAGLIEEASRKPGGKGRALLRLELTEQGWFWLSEHLDEPISPPSKFATDVLVKLLAQLKVHLETANLSLGEFIAARPRASEPVENGHLGRLTPHLGPPPQGGREEEGKPSPLVGEGGVGGKTQENESFLDAHSTRAGQSIPGPDLSQRIEAACLALTGGRPNARVALADLREALADVPRADLDAELLALATSGGAALYRLDNPLEIGPRERAATWRTPSGEERHILYFRGRPS